jgi:hypothetical protein
MDCVADDFPGETVFIIFRIEKERECFGMPNNAE